MIFIPAIVFFAFRKKPPRIARHQLLAAAIFGIAFGFVESSVVVYLRAASGLLPGYMGGLADVIRQAPADYQQLQTLTGVPRSLLTIELIREAATLIMLVTVAALSAVKFKERFALFLWVFAFWDIFYYIGLWSTIRWPGSLMTTDVLFLIPVPWISQVWFPCLVSGLTISVIVMITGNPDSPRG